MNATRGEAVRMGETGSWGNGKVRKFARLLIPAVLAMVTVAAMLSGAQASAKTKKVQSPSGFTIDHDARLAADGDDLWLAALGKAGHNGESGLRTKLLTTKHGKGWTTLPSHPRTSGDYPLQLALLKRPGWREARPCIGDTPSEGGRIRCYERNRFKTMELAEPLQGLNLVGLTGNGKSITALFNEWSRNPTESHLRVAKLEGDRFEPFGPPVGLQGQILAGLGESTRLAKSGSVDVALQLVSSEDSGKRLAASVTRSGWKFDNLPEGLVGGSQLSGPVRTDIGLYFPANQDEFSGRNAGTPGTFSVFGDVGTGWSETGDRPVSRGKGYAQGAIDPVGNDVWATWQESRNRGANVAKSRTLIHAALLDYDGEKFTDRVTLWRGGPIGPGFTQAIRHKGKPVFSYMRNINGNTKATVDLTLAD